MYTLYISEGPAHIALCQKGPEIVTLQVFLVSIKYGSERWNVEPMVQEKKNVCFSFHIKKCLRFGERHCMEAKQDIFTKG